MGKYSIILPVRNGGEYVKECVRSILNQSYHDFNFIVLDNCSTDDTVPWIESIGDARIRIHKAGSPLTIEENWGRIVGVTKNEFITLIGHDDVLDPNYLQVMNTLVENHPSASIYQAHFRFIDHAGNKIRSCKQMKEVESSAEFLESFLTNNIDVMGTGFLMRSADYDALGGIPPYPSLLFADFDLFIRLSSLSYKATATAECFSFRIHQSTTTSSKDVIMHRAFEKFIYFLVDLQTKNTELKPVIERNGEAFLGTYCKGLAHRLLRTPMSKRNGLTVRTFLEECRQYSRLLIPSSNFDPLHIPSVRLACIIDSNAIGRTGFLLFKKLFPKPVLK